MTPVAPHTSHRVAIGDHVCGGGGGSLLSCLHNDWNGGAGGGTPSRRRLRYKCVFEYSRNIAFLALFVFYHMCGFSFPLRGFVIMDSSYITTPPHNIWFSAPFREATTKKREWKLACENTKNQRVINFLPSQSAAPLHDTYRRRPIMHTHIRWLIVHTTTYARKHTRERVTWVTAVAAATAMAAAVVGMFGLGGAVWFGCVMSCVVYVVGVRHRRRRRRHRLLPLLVID